MKLMSVLNSFLESFYVSFAPPAGAECAVSAKAFYESVILEAVRSPEFRKRLLDSPEEVLAEAGIRLPEGMKVHFVENTADTVHIVIPPYVGE